MHPGHGGPPPTGPGGDFAISDFMSKVDNLGSYAKRNRFTVEIIPPITLSTSVPASQIEFLVKAISFPSRTFGGSNNLDSWHSDFHLNCSGENLSLANWSLCFLL